MGPSELYTVEFNPRVNLNNIFWQLRGLERLFSSKNKAVLSAVKMALLSIEKELKPLEPSPGLHSPLGHINLTDEEIKEYSKSLIYSRAPKLAKELEGDYRIVKGQLDEMKRFVRQSIAAMPKYPDMGKLFQNYGLQITDREIDQLRKGIAIVPRRKSTLPAPQAVAICLALDIKIPIYNRSFQTEGVAKGEIAPGHLKTHKKNAPEILVNMDQKYRTKAEQYWENGYTAKRPRKGKERAADS